MPHQHETLHFLQASCCFVFLNQNQESLLSEELNRSVRGWVTRREVSIYTHLLQSSLLSSLVTLVQQWFKGVSCPGSLAGGRKRQFFHHEQAGKRATAAEKNHLVACAGCHFWKEQWNCHVITGISYTLSFSPHRESVSVIFRGNWRHRKIDAASARHSGQLLLRDISLRCAWQ